MTTLEKDFRDTSVAIARRSWPTLSMSTAGQALQRFQKCEIMAPLPHTWSHSRPSLCPHCWLPLPMGGRGSRGSCSAGAPQLRQAAEGRIDPCPTQRGREAFEQTVRGYKDDG